MKNLVDFFPDTPESFHLRVEESLLSLEEKEMKNVSVFSRRMIAAIAAILIIALAATAVAVVQGDLLRTRMTQAGVQRLADQVQDVHVSDAQDDFSFTIDEILWEEDVLFVSYSVAVPQDGNVYLFSPCDVQLDGRDIGYEGGIDAEFFACMYALGGEYGTSVSQIMQMKVPEAVVGDASRQFSCSCVFMQAARPLKKLDTQAYYALFTAADEYGNADQMMQNADTLYYTDTTEGGDPVPVLYLHPYPEVRSAMNENDVVSPKALEQTGIAACADLRTVTIPVQKSAAAAIRFNDAAQKVFPMDGYSIEITQLNLSRFSMQYQAIIRKDGGEMTEWSENEPYGQFYDLCNADGSDFGAHTSWSMGGGMTALDDDGETVYCIDGNSAGIYPVEELTEIYLAPAIYDENGEYAGRDMTRAIRLSPIYTQDLPNPETVSKPDPAETDDLSS